MNDEKPNTAAQREVDSILQDDREARTQKYLGSLVKEMEERPNKDLKEGAVNSAQQDLQKEINAQEQTNGHDYGMSL